MKNEEIERVERLHRTMVGLDGVMRKGWEAWGVKKPRNESVAEHCFDTMWLAYALWMEYGDEELERDLRENGFEGEGELDVVGRVLPMLLMHETDETGLGDKITITAEDRKAKEAEGHEVVREVYGGFRERGEGAVEMLFEFDAGETMDAKFAFLCDKAVASIRAERLRQEGFDARVEDVDADFAKNPNFIEMKAQGMETMSEMWWGWWRKLYGGTVFGRLMDLVREG